ncbi:hypothetical protein WAI453_009763 [Rhynchosporium graminicola]
MEHIDSDTPAPIKMEHSDPNVLNTEIELEKTASRAPAAEIKSDEISMEHSNSTIPAPVNMERTNSTTPTAEINSDEIDIRHSSPTTPAPAPVDMTNTNSNILAVEIKMEKTASTALALDMKMKDINMEHEVSNPPAFDISTYQAGSKVLAVEIKTENRYPTAPVSHINDIVIQRTGLKGFLELTSGDKIGVTTTEHTDSTAPATINMEYTEPFTPTPVNMPNTKSNIPAVEIKLEKTAPTVLAQEINIEDLENMHSVPSAIKRRRIVDKDPITPPADFDVKNDADSTEAAGAGSKDEINVNPIESTAPAAETKMNDTNSLTLAAELKVENSSLIPPNGDIKKEETNPSVPDSSLGYERSPEDIQDEASFRSNAIFKSWEKLQSLLDLHQDTINARWIKKSGASRKEFLMEVWPGIPRKHRPDFAIFEKEPPEKPLRHVITDPEELSAAKWPNFNLEDLSKGRHLLILMEARARCFPKLFARPDLEASLVNSAVGSFSTATCSGHSMSLSGDNNDSYGKLLRLEGNQSAQDRLKYGIDFDIFKGLLILEIQQKLLQFLESCCEKILHDKKLPETIQSRTSLNELNKSAPYYAPGSFDFRSLMLLLATQLTEAIDHLWDLRTDPGYFLDVVTECVESSIESVCDEHGQSDTKYGTRNHWELCAVNVSEEAYSRVIMAEICLHLTTDMHRTFGDWPEVGQLPSESPDHQRLLDQMLVLRHIIDVQYDLDKDMLARRVSAEVSFCYFFYKEHRNSREVKWIVPSPERPDKLMSLLQAFGFFDREIESQMGRRKLLAEIESVLESNPDEKIRLSPITQMMLGKVGFGLRAIQIIDLVSPSVPVSWARILDENGEELSKLDELVRPELATHTQFKDDFRGMSYDGFGSPESGRFNYPCWKTRTPETIRQMCRAERCLDEYWEKIDRSFHRSCGKSIHDLEPPIFKDRQKLRTREPMCAYKESGTELDEIDTALALLDMAADKNISAVQDETQASNTKMLAVLGTKSSDFVFTERALKVFRKMFSTPSSAPPGHIKWNDFLNAMSDSGFNITKQYGSLWLFTPVSLDGCVFRSIFLHEPPLDPTSKSGLMLMEYKIAQRLARRLYYMYGWEQSWFVRK